VQPEFTDADVALNCQLTDINYPVCIDKHQFSHAIVNLLRNAREAVEQRRDESAGADFQGEVTTRTFENDKAIMIEISDNGVGIKPGDEEKIFEVFYTTKEKGTGLGLGIVRRIIEEHRGKIYAATNQIDGAKFIIAIPRAILLEFKN
jgi:two-component system nitrogen regulation sensor histidine kinase NtrY